LDKGIYVYKEVYPPTILSFFSFIFMQHLVFYPIQLVLSSSLVLSIPSPLSSPAKPPVLVQPSQACPAKFLPLPYRKFPALQFHSLPTVILHYITILYRTHTISKPAPVPDSPLIVRILADYAHAIEALATTSANSLDPATLCASYEGAVNLACVLNTSENLTNWFTALTAEIEDLSLDRDTAVVDRDMLSTRVTQLESQLSQTLALANLASSSIPTPCKTQPDPKPFTGEERNKL
jgi:hypothetical protein